MNTNNTVLQITEHQENKIKNIEYNNSNAIRNLVKELKKEMHHMRRCYRKAELKYSIIPTLENYLSDLENLGDE
tara:strand:- start:759 stop:980 length:222 start_codon:yes stop_codon:yes gene_type:complete